MAVDLAAAARRLLTADAVRQRAQAMLALARDDRLLHLAVDPDRLPAAADYVIDTVRDKYPGFDIPFHARWRHFAVGADRWGALVARAGWADAAERARAAFDLAIVSVLLDAGAGPAWRYRDPATGESYARSEGLAIASLCMFAAGLFSAWPGQSLRADASALRMITAHRLAKAFQVASDNPLVGLDGRAALLNRLGEAAAARPDIFGIDDAPRPGGLYDTLAASAKDGSLPAGAILDALLAHLGPIWPGRIALGGVELGDTWRHPLIEAGDGTTGLVPFHKLSQWLAYSLIEPLQDAGLTITDIGGLTGLSEYRNGGLFVDLGVIRLRDAKDATRAHEVGSPLVVEWRALTVALLDEIAGLVLAKLGKTPAELPLAKVLEGGTWSAGRRIARERRADGGPPLQVVSDGTVF